MYSDTCPPSSSFNHLSFADVMTVSLHYRMQSLTASLCAFISSASVGCTKKFQLISHVQYYFKYYLELSWTCKSNTIKSTFMTMKSLFFS